MKAILRNLEDVAVLVGGGTPSRTNSEYFDGDIPWVTPSDLPTKGNVRSLGPAAEAITRIGLQNSSAKLLPPGTVLFSTRATIGKIAVADRECSTNQGFCNFIPVVDVIDSWYLAYYLAAVTDDIVALAGRTTFREVGRKQLRAFSIPVPPLNEQRQVVRHLDRCMERVDEIQKLNSEAATEAAALLPSSLAAYFAELDGTYPTATVGDCLVESRYGTSRRCNAGAAAVPVLRIPNVVRGRISVDNLKYCELNNEELERFRMHSGDVLVVRTNGSADLVGRCAVHVDSARSFAFASYLIRLRVDPAKVLPVFLMFFLTSTMGRDAIAAIRRTSAGQFNINVQNLRGIRLPLPPLAIQERVAARLVEQRDVAAAIAAIQATHAADTNLLRNAVLRRAFAGDL
ncbi:MAG: hypothetical protein F4137_20940 [Acidobacteria bacterium]|nr:hypothetical protein [Acidobacteriota bacterium]